MSNTENYNNEQQFTESNYTVNEPSNKKNGFFKTLLIIIGAITCVLLLVFGLYKLLVDTSNKHLDNFDYNLNEELTEIKEYTYLDFVSYDSKNDPNTLSISIPKVYTYEKIIDIRSLAKDFDDNYELHINRIGYKTNENEKNIIDFYADVTYKTYINAYVHGQMEIVFTDDNGLQLVLKDIYIGDNLPEFIYRSFLPIKSQDIIYELKADEFEFLKEKLLDLKLISDIKIDSENINFKFDVMSNVNIIIKYIFGDDAAIVEEFVKELFPEILNGIINETE